MTPPKEIAEIDGLLPLESEHDPCVYFLVSEGRVVYVGKTIRLARRLLEHKTKAYDEVYFVRCSANRLHLLEREWITRLTPEMNVLKGRKKLERTSTASAKERERGAQQFLLLEQARAELKKEMGIGKNAPSSDQLAARIDEIKACVTERSVTSASAF